MMITILSTQQMVLHQSQVLLLVIGQGLSPKMGVWYVQHRARKSRP